MRLFGWTLWRKSAHSRRSGFRVVEETASRIVIRTRSYSFLAGGSVFIASGAAFAWLGVPEVSGEPGMLALTLGFAALLVLFGLAFVWASRAQRDTIIVDRDAGTIRSERARKRRRPRDEPFRIQERSIDGLRSVGLRYGSSLGWLSFRFRAGKDLEIDHATDIEHLKSLGERLARVSGVELEES